MYENELALASGWFGVQRFVFSASEMMFACHPALRMFVFLLGVSVDP
jgi:hypothetical protein